MKRILFLLSLVVFTSCYHEDGLKNSTAPKVDTTAAQEKITIPDSVLIISQRDISELKEVLKKQLTMATYEYVGAVIDKNMPAKFPADSSLLFSAKDFIRTETEIKKYVTAYDYEVGIYRTAQSLLSFTVQRFHNRQKN